MSVHELPENYILAKSIDLKSDRSLTTFLNVIGTVIFLAVIGTGFLLHPFPEGFSFDIYDLLVLVGGLALYVILHELLHALFMWIFLKEKLNFGFQVKAAYAGMKKGYFSKREYFIIALAPVLLLGIGIFLLSYFLDVTWFWPLQIIQGQNLAGAVGDYYVIVLLMKMPRTAYINDVGMAMRYYVPSKGTILMEKASSDSYDGFL
jgi:hypothetical protein